MTPQDHAGGLEPAGRKRRCICRHANRADGVLLESDHWPGWRSPRLFAHTANLCLAQVEDCRSDCDAHDAGDLGYSSGNLG